MVRLGAFKDRSAAAHAEVCQAPNAEVKGALRDAASSQYHSYRSRKIKNLARGTLASVVITLAATSCTADAPSAPVNTPEANCSVNGGSNLGQLPQCNPANPYDVAQTPHKSVIFSRSTPAESEQRNKELLKDLEEAAEGLAIFALAIASKKIFLPSRYTIRYTTNEKRLQRLAEKSHRKGILRAVAQNPFTPKQSVRKLAEHADMDVSIYAAFHDKLDHDGFKAVAYRFGSMPVDAQKRIFNQKVISFLVDKTIFTKVDQEKKMKAFLKYSTISMQDQQAMCSTCSSCLQSEMQKKAIHDSHIRPHEEEDEYERMMATLHPRQDYTPSSDSTQRETD